MADRLETGTVWVNCWLLRDLRVPFGGTKQSGVGREGGDEAIRFFTAARAIRPETAHQLAHALEKRGDYDEAIAAFRDLNGLAIWMAYSTFFSQLGGDAIADHYAKLFSL